MRCWFHTWTKWEDKGKHRYVSHHAHEFQYVALIQHSRCTKCNKLKIQEIALHETGGGFTEKDVQVNT